MQFDGEEIHGGIPCLKYVRRKVVLNKNNTYTIYVTKEKPHKPVRFILDGYDALLHAPYDYYVIDYMTFHKWKFNFKTMKIPRGKMFIAKFPFSLIYFNTWMKRVSVIEFHTKINKADDQSQIKPWNATLNISIYGHFWVSG